MVKIQEQRSESDKLDRSNERSTMVRGRWVLERERVLHLLLLLQLMRVLMMLLAHRDELIQLGRRVDFDVDDDDERLCSDNAGDSRLGKKWPIAVWNAMASAAMLEGESMNGGASCAAVGCGRGTIICGSTCTTGIATW